MTTDQTTRRVVVLGPLRDGSIHVHAFGCGDVARNRAYRQADGFDARTPVDVDSLRDVVHYVYPPESFDYDGESDWRDFAGEVKVFPCVRDLPDVPPDVDDDPSSNALHPVWLSMFRAVVHGEDSHGVTDVEFPSLHAAASWAQSSEVAERVRLRDPDSVRFVGTVTVQLMPGRARVAREYGARVRACA